MTSEQHAGYDEKTYAGRTSRHDFDLKGPTVTTIYRETAGTSVEIYTQQIDIRRKIGKDRRTKIA